MLVILFEYRDAKLGRGLMVTSLKFSGGLVSIEVAVISGGGGWGRAAVSGRDSTGAGTQRLVIGHDGVTL